MAWIKLDDQWMDNPKIVEVGRDGRDIWLASITYCAKHLTDGRFHKNLLPALAAMAGIDLANVKQIASDLLEVRLWEASGNYYYVHDYLEYNPTKEQTELNKQTRSEAGRLGGKAKASKMLAKPKQNASKMPSKNVAKVCPVPVPVPVPVSLPVPGEGEGAYSPPINQFSLDETIESLKITTMYESVTGNMGVPSDMAKVDFILRSIQVCYDKYKAATKEYLQPFFDEWIERKYSRMNPAWLEWALAGEIPEKREGRNTPKASTVFNPYAGAIRYD